MSEQDFLSGHFLIAMPGLGDPNFYHSVSLICEHSSEGAMGITINRPLDDIHLEDVFQQMELTPEAPEAGQQPLFSGGPVERERGFVIHRPVGEWEATLNMGDGIGVTSSRDILSAIAEGKGPKQSFVALGYAGWGAGQLEQEISENAWLSCPAESRILFDVPPSERWREAARAMGVDLNRLSGQSGHA